MLRLIRIAAPWIIMGIVLAGPRAALACAACSGRSDDTMAHALNAAVLTLLAVVLFVMGAVLGSVATLIRRAVRHPLGPPSMPGGVVQ